MNKKLIALLLCLALVLSLAGCKKDVELKDAGDDKTVTQATDQDKTEPTPEAQDVKPDNTAEEEPVVTPVKEESKNNADVSNEAKVKNPYGELPYDDGDNGGQQSSANADAVKSLLLGYITDKTVDGDLKLKLDMAVPVHGYKDGQEYQSIEERNVDTYITYMLQSNGKVAHFTAKLEGTSSGNPASSEIEAYFDLDSMTVYSKVDVLTEASLGTWKASKLDLGSMLSGMPKIDTASIVTTLMSSVSTTVSETEDEVVTDFSLDVSSLVDSALSSAGTSGQAEGLSAIAGPILGIIKDVTNGVTIDGSLEVDKDGFSTTLNLALNGLDYTAEYDTSSEGENSSSGANTALLSALNGFRIKCDEGRVFLMIRNLDHDIAAQIVIPDEVLSAGKVK